MYELRNVQWSQYFFGITYLFYHRVKLENCGVCPLYHETRPTPTNLYGCQVTSTGYEPGACVSKAPQTFRARKAIFLNRYLKTESRCIRLKLLVRNGTFVYVKNV